MKNLTAEVKNFWNELAADGKRLICLIALVALSLVYGPLSTIVSVLLLVGCSYLAAMFGLLQVINWRSEKHQKVVTLFLIFVDCWIAFSLIGGVAGIILKSLMAIAIVMILVKFILANYPEIIEKLKNQTKQ